MALTRKFLSAMGIDEEKIDEIISAHSETVSALKEQRDSYKESAEKLSKVEKELNELKKTADGENPFEQKYNDLKRDFDTFKTNVENEKILALKTKGVQSLLKEINVSDLWAEKIVKLTDFDDIELDGDKIKDYDDLKAKYQKDYADYIVNTETKGADTATPPDKNPKVDYDKMSDEDYYKSIFKKET